MKKIEINSTHNKEAINEILEISGERIQDCMQCGKCSAGCPASESMDLLPHQAIRLLQLGQLDRLKESNTIWICASCFTCGQRCPREVDLSKLMEAVRLTIIRRVGASKLKADDVPNLLDNKIPQQAIVSAFRKHHK
ncbi:4Fe-4S dicluster domain-containing protein [Garciella nitratireducens]|uniref:Heterodisulfide reductase subunit C n=1 Tax=Garciella nitratireducens DSM 15102 TaxID=1121911 RepID=A0A1T4KDN8_9FIRM|nr:4Fe-4S dicluster domain-containing protein [Garciella nitratireducens]RBP42745.1 heterodisulfide reductase subunit C [Garciella nitratireducens]SJZ40465.1 heterodisulfide reductase subunit C [Garciella nitratireducens DSM 15102]